MSGAQVLVAADGERRFCARSMEALPQRQRVATYGRARRDGRVLLVRASNSGTWWLPGGGLKFAETPSDGLAREMDEETGLRLSAFRLVDVISDVTELATEPVLIHSVRVIYEVDLCRLPA